MIQEPSARRFVGWAGFLLAIVAFATLLPGLGDVGIAWDEPYYFDSTRRIQEWASQITNGPDRWSQFRQEEVRSTFDWRRYWNPHPPAYKLVMAATEGVFGRWTGEVVGYRLTPLAFFCLLVAMVTWLAGFAWGRVAGVGAGLSLLLMPRVVGHAHIAATDTVLACAWFAASAGLALYVTHNEKRFLAAGILALGVALATKFTGYLLPLAMLLWLIPYGRSKRGFVGAIRWGIGGLIVAWILNPLMWHDPVAETLRLVSDSVSRSETIPIASYYLGRSWGYEVPGHQAIVMTLITVPLSILVLAGWGTAASAKRWEEDAVSGLCFTQMLFWIALMAAPGSPNHDGVRLWLPMFPFVAVLAGRGLASMAGIARRRLAEDGGLAVTLVLMALFFVPAFAQTIGAAPYYLAYYSEAIGGARGAARAGMESTYWLEVVTPAFLEKVEETVPPGARMSAWPNVEHYEWLQDNGMLRRDIVVTRETPADYLLLVARKAAFKPYHWRIYENVQPELAVELEGVELAGLYAWQADEDTDPDREEP